MPAATLLLMPGLDGTGDLFAPLLATEMLRDWPVHVVTYPAGERREFAELVAVAKQFLPADGRVILVAESFSGPIAVALAAANPARVAGLILVASFATSPRPVVLRFAKVLPLSWLLRVSPPRWAVRAWCVGWDAPAATVQLFFAALKKVSPRVLAQRFRLLATIDVRRELAAVRDAGIPCAIVHPTGDWLVPHSVSRFFRRALPAAEYVRIVGPHFVAQSRPAQIAEIIAGCARDWFGRPA